MPPIITGLTASTELEAVNTMLSAVGEAPIADLSSTATDVTMATNILRNACREVQTLGWRFNTEFGYEVPSTEDGYEWLDTRGETTPLSIFLPPAGLATFRVSQCPEQQFGRLIDTVIRPSRRYGVPTAPPTSVLDPLTVSSGTQLLTDHTSPDGYGYTLVSSYGSGDPTVSTTGASWPHMSKWYRFGFPVPTADYSVEADVVFTGLGSVDLSLLLRMSETTQERYEWSWGGSGGYLTYVNAAGAATTLGTPPNFYPVIGQSYHVKVSVTGTLLECFVDGVLRCMATDTRLTAAGRGGIGGYGQPNIAPGNYMNVTNYKVSYLAVGRADPGTLVFYDRAFNRDGFPTLERTSLYIDPVWLFDFESLPETARRYIITRAAREFAQQVVGSAELSAFSERDELYALRALKRDHGQSDDVNVFDNVETGAFLGGRSSYPQGAIDLRRSRGPA